MKAWTDGLIAQLRHRPHLHLFTDFDGTLTPIAPTPAEARLSPRAHAVLARLQARPRTTLTLVSGRPVGTLREKAPVEGAIYVGNHGMEVWRDGGRVEHPVATAARPAVARLGARFVELLRAHPKAVLEQKGISLSLHTRLLDEEARAEVERAAHALAAGEPALEASTGKRVVEVRPRRAPHKGDAIVALLDEAHGSGWQEECAAVFLGDDLTDEDGFRVLMGRGFGVMVREGEPRQSAAEWTAHGVDDALGLLEAIVVD